MAMMDLVGAGLVVVNGMHARQNGEVGTMSGDAGALASAR